MKIEIHVESPHATIVLEEERLDAATAADFRERLADVVPDQAVHLKLDLSAVAFIDSSGIGALVSLLKAIGPEGDLELCGLRDSVRSVFELTHMDRVFSLKPALAP